MKGWGGGGEGGGEAGREGGREGGRQGGRGGRDRESELQVLTHQGKVQD